MARKEVEGDVAGEDEEAGEVDREKLGEEAAGRVGVWSEDGVGAGVGVG